MESNYKEDVSTLNKKEIVDRRDILSRDKKFIDYKILYWNAQHKLLRELEVRILKRSFELKGVCEICEEKQPEDGDKLRTLPTGEQVCKKCWKERIEEALLKNSNNNMVG